MKQIEEVLQRFDKRWSRDMAASENIRKFIKKEFSQALEYGYTQGYEMGWEEGRQILDLNSKKKT